VRATFLAVVPDRVAFAVRPSGTAANRQWLFAAQRDTGTGALQGQAAAIVPASRAAHVGGGGCVVLARRDTRRASSTSPFDARAPPRHA